MADASQARTRGRNTRAPRHLEPEEVQLETEREGETERKRKWVRRVEGGEDNGSGERRTEPSFWANYSGRAVSLLVFAYM